MVFGFLSNSAVPLFPLAPTATVQMHLFFGAEPQPVKASNKTISRGFIIEA